MTPDPIAAARAMIEPLTGYASGPWSKISAGSNSYHIGSGGWTVDASDPDGGYFEEYHICKTTGYYDAAGADARLMTAAPDLRDMVATPADAQAALDKLLAEARLEGWRAGQDAAAMSCVLSGQDLVEGGWGPEGWDMAVTLETRILAMPEPKEPSHG